MSDALQHVGIRDHKRRDDRVVGVRQRPAGAPTNQPPNADRAAVRCGSGLPWGCWAVCLASCSGQS